MVRGRNYFKGEKPEGGVGCARTALLDHSEGQKRLLLALALPTGAANTGASSSSATAAAAATAAASTTGGGRSGLRRALRPARERDGVGGASEVVVELHAPHRHLELPR